MEPATITGAITALHKLSAIVKSGVETYEKTKKLDADLFLGEIQKNIISLQTEMLNIQQQIQALETKRTELENSISEIHEWSNEKKRYKPVEELGRFVYMLAIYDNEAEGLMHFCPECYQNGMARILQPTGYAGSGAIVFKCLSCKSDF